MSAAGPAPDQPGYPSAIPVLERLDLRSAEAIVETLDTGALANLHSPCRRGSIDLISADPAAPAVSTRLILTGDLHDHPLHLARLIRAAAMDRDPDATAHSPPTDPRPLAHLTLHELIHGDRLTNGMDFSYRVLARAAALKAAFPEHVHTLLANHELAQVLGSGIVKDGVRVVEAFNDAVSVTFGDRAGEVDAAIRRFVRSMPLALRVSAPAGDGRPDPPDLLCAHSLPGPEMMGLFEPTVLERDLTEDDYTPRRGSAHLMVWGRGHTPDQLTELAHRWNVGLFVLGHEKAEAGLLPLSPNAVVLNSDHDRGVYLDLDAGGPHTLASAFAGARPLAQP